MPARRGMKIVGEKSSGRCLDFSFESGRRWCAVASKDSSSECPIFKRSDI